MNVILSETKDLTQGIIMPNDIAIKVNNVSKLYKLYDRNIDRLRDSLGLTRSKRYKEHYALHNISFDIEKGECVGIIGTNGAGKSTILKIITGVLSPTEGSVEIDGRISALLELGAGFNMEYTGIENIYLNGTMIGFSKEEIDSKLQSILDFADIGDFVYQPVKTYSSGMFVRLAFAVAINIDPEILIVDEALSVGDVFFQLKCFKKFEEFKAAGKTILFVSHDLSSIERYCDRAILLDHGHNVAEGTPIDIVNTYKKLMSGMTIEDIEALKQSEDSHTEDSKQVKGANSTAEGIKQTGSWKDKLTINPNVDEYGAMDAKIVDFGVFDDSGIVTTTIIKGSTFTIRSKVLFNIDVAEPIFTFTFKTLKGEDITGTNTMIEKVFVEKAQAGETYVASFTQDMNLQGGEYLLSISCTSIVNGELVVHDRLYDVLNITVVSSKNTVGYYDMNSVTQIEKV